MTSMIVMKNLALATFATLALAACTTAERTATGTGVGAVVGAVVTDSVGGAVVGAVIGGLGTYIAEVGDGRCQYRDSRGHIITRRCHWL